MISKKAVDFFAHRCGARDQLVAEREVVLTYALHLLWQRGVCERLAFKGGTALRKLVFGTGGRFSEDLDFTLCAGEQDEAVIGVVDALDGTTHHGVTFTIPEEDLYETDDSFGAIVRYTHAWNGSGSFKLQVSVRETPTFPVIATAAIVQPYFDDLEFGAPPAVPALEPIEMIAEKVRAAFQRVKVRDVYDLYLYATLDGTKGFDIELLRGLVVLKLWQARHAFDASALFGKLHGGVYEWSELDHLLPPGKRVDLKEILRAIEHRLGGLRALTDLEKRVVADSSSGWNETLASELRERVRARLIPR
jgi:predicted nucleotidyltransferase component of viral defense system